MGDPITNRPDPAVAELTEREAAELAEIIARTKWKFAWTYARTYPHEYTTKSLCQPEDHARLIDCIERLGVVEPFGASLRKYWYFQGRRYWHMGNPSSADPADWPNVINRAWVDVRRHAENVRHRWTEEELEVQVRLWEILHRKATAGRTGRRRSAGGHDSEGRATPEPNLAGASS